MTAVGNSHTKRHLPVWTDHSRISLSAEPETKKRDCAAGSISKSTHKRGKGGERRAGGREETRTVDVYCPDGAVVSAIGPETLAVVREPDIYDVVFGGGKEEIALLVEFYLRE